MASYIWRNSTTRSSGSNSSTKYSQSPVQRQPVNAQVMPSNISSPMNQNKTLDISAQVKLDKDRGAMDGSGRNPPGRLGTQMSQLAVETHTDFSDEHNSESGEPSVYPLTVSQLEALVCQREPVDISHKVELFAKPPIDDGGYGQVRLGRMDGNLVAVKVLKIQSVRDRVVTERRLRREITVWAVLKHPNVAKFEGYVTRISEYSAIVSKWCQNGNATQYFEANPSIPVQKRISLGKDVAKGLAYLHSLEIIHGDLKPSNILISDEGRAQLCDFGLARLVDWENQRGLDTKTAYERTLKYKAYELLRTRNNRNPQPTFSSDVYALGCVLYEFVYLKEPFHDLEIVELVGAIRSCTPPATRPRTLNTKEGYLWDVFAHCWRPDPQQRPSAKVVVSWLQDRVGVPH